MLLSLNIFKSKIQKCHILSTIVAGFARCFFLFHLGCLQLLTVPQCLSHYCLIPVHLWQPCAYLTFCRVRGPELHDNVGCCWRSKNSKEQMYGPMLARYTGSAFIYIYISVCCTLFSSSCFFSLCQYCCY